MSSNRRPRASWLGGAAALVAVWVLLWEDFSVANLLSGVLVALAVLALLNRRIDDDHEHIHPLAGARLTAWFAWQLVVASSVVAWEVLTPTQRARQGIVEIELRSQSQRVAALVANITSLIPGTLTLEVATEPMRLYVHVLHLKDPDAVRADAARLEDLVMRAIAPSTVPDSTNSAPDGDATTLEQEGRTR